MASSIILSNLNKYVDESSSQILAKIILTPKLISMVNKITGVKYKTKLRLATSNTIFQVGNCDLSPLGDYTLLDKEALVRTLAVRETICLTAESGLESYWPGQFMKAMGSYNDRVPTEVVDAYILSKSQDVSRDMNRLAFQGNTGLTASTNLNKIDGWLTQFKADSEVRVYGLTAGATAKLTSANAITVIDGIIAKGSEDLLEQPDRIIVVSPANFNTIVKAYFNLGGAGNYNYSVTDVKDSGEFVLPTDDVTVIRDAGLQGSNEIFYTTKQNLYILMDQENDADKMRMVWDEVTWKIIVTIFFKLGVSYAYGDYVVRYTGVPLS